MAKIIALYNQAGGVGKTTSTVNIGYELVERGRKVLNVDIDPQGTLTVFMGIEDPNALEKTVYDGLMHQESMPILKDIYGMDLIPANENLEGVEKQLIDEKIPELRLKHALEPFHKDYDFILLDCPPRGGFLSISCLVAATHIVTPIETAYKARKGTENLIRTIKRIWEYANPDLKFAGVIPTLYSANKNQDRRSLESIKQSFDTSQVLAVVPEATDVENASEAGVPIKVYDPKNAAVKPFEQIAEYLDHMQ